MQPAAQHLRAWGFGLASPSTDLLGAGLDSRRAGFDLDLAACDGFCEDSAAASLR